MWPLLEARVGVEQPLPVGVLFLLEEVNSFAKASGRSIIMSGDELSGKLSDPSPSNGRFKCIAYLCAMHEEYTHT